MEQFNLEEYLKNPSRQVVTRDGRPDDKGEEFIGKKAVSPLSKKEGWTNVYKNSFDQLFLGSNFPYKTEDEARNASVLNAKYEIYCGTVRLEWEE